jgi:MSHA biogenesis protein MshN
MDVFAMSLINSMLRDLEARRSDGAAAAPFQGQVRAVPARPAPTMKFKLAAVAGGVLLLVVAAVASQRLWQAPAPARQAATVPAVAPPAAVAASTAPTVAVAVAVTTPQDESATGKPAPVASEPVAKTADASETPTTAMAAAASNPATASASTPTKLATSDAPAPPTVLAPSVASAPPAKPAKSTRPTEQIALAPQAPGAGSQPVTAPARRLPMQAGAMPQAQPRAEAMPPQPVAASVAVAVPAPTAAMPAAEPLKIVREPAAPALPQPDMAMQLARQQLQDNALREAIDTLQRTLPQAGSRADYHAFLAALLQRDDQHRAAAEHYATALRGAPDNGVWWMGLGISYQALQMATQAQQAYRSAQASRTLSPELAAFVEARLGQLPRP